MNQQLPETIVERYGPFTISVSTRELVREGVMRALAADAPLVMPHGAVIPKIGEYCPAQCGINGGRFIDEQDRIYFLIVARRAEGQIAKATWKDAGQKAAALRVGGLSDWTLPNRAEGLGMFESLHPRLKGTDDAFPDEAHWLVTQLDAHDAWCQGFGDGSQVYFTQYYEFWARAVRRVVISQ